MPSRPSLQAYNAFEPHLAGVAEDQLPIMGEVLVQTQSRMAPTEEARECRLARLQRLGPQVLAVQFEEVEGVEKDMLGRQLEPQPRLASATGLLRSTKTRLAFFGQSSRLGRRRENPARVRLRNEFSNGKPIDRFPTVRRSYVSPILGARRA
jgi:hypothetical protein